MALPVLIGSAVWHPAPFPKLLHGMIENRTGLPLVCLCGKSSATLLVVDTVEHHTCMSLYVLLLHCTYTVIMKCRTLCCAGAQCRCVVSSHICR